MSELLRSWKEIARHLGTSVRTAQRWERVFRLPVRRIDGKRGAVVFAFAGELEGWLRARSDSRLPLVQDSFFRTVFMDSQFPSLVVDDIPRVLAANSAACSLVGAPNGQLMGEQLQHILHAQGRTPEGPGSWRDGFSTGSCFGQANLQRRDGRVLGVGFVVKRFAAGLYVVSVLSAHKQWRPEQLWCRPLKAEFSFRVRAGSPSLTPARRKAASVGAS